MDEEKEYELDFTDVTPTVPTICTECTDRPFTKIVDDSVPQPRSADEAWEKWNGECVTTESNLWSFCSVNGFGWIPGRVRVNWERRKVPR